MALSPAQSNWAEQPLAVVRWFAAMASHMEPARLETFLPHILAPVYRLIEDDTIHDRRIGANPDDLFLFPHLMDPILHIFQMR